MSYYTLTGIQSDDVTKTRTEGSKVIAQMKALIEMDERASLLLDENIEVVEMALSHDETSVTGGDYQIWMARSTASINMAKVQIERLS